MKKNEKRLFLIKWLIKDLSLTDIIIPNDENEQKSLLRSLMNIRNPKPVSNEFLKIQDEYLKEEIKTKGITDCTQISFLQDRLCLWQGDITTLKCDAVVNAANSAMLGCFVPCHKCIDNAIHTFSGVELRLKCNEIMVRQGYDEPIAGAKITPAYNLPCKYIIHTVGPIINGSLTDEDCKHLALCYRESIRLADKNNIKSIAFCCISTGEFHFPNEKAAEIAVQAVKNSINNTGIERVIFNVFKDIDRQIYEKLLG